LTSNWSKKRGNEFTPTDALVYIQEIEREKDQAKALYERFREYIVNGPSQIQAPVRKIIGQTRGWKHAELSKTLFDAEDSAD